MRIRARLIGFIAFFQSVLFLLHFFLYETWKFSPAGNDPPCGLVAQDRRRRTVHQFFSNVASGLSLHECFVASHVSSRRRLAWMAEFLLLCGMHVLDYFRNRTAGGNGREFPSDRGGVVRSISGAGFLRPNECGLDADSADQRPIGKSAASLARTQGRATQRSAPRARSKRPVSEADRG